MNLPLFIARRYLFAKKSHNVINTISAISAIGMAVGTAALVIVMSVYNGFSEMVSSTLSSVDPDILIAPAHGKVFVPEGEAFTWIKENPEYSKVFEVLQDNVFVDYDGHQSVAKAKGVGDDYAEGSPLVKAIFNGQFSLHLGDVPMMAVGSGLANKLGLNPSFLALATVYYPNREKNISLANPAAALETVRLKPSGVFSVNQQIDNELMVMPIEQMRALLGYDNEVSGIEIRLGDLDAATGMASDRTTRRAVKELRSMLGKDFVVMDRIQQNPSVFKMMRYEKAAIFTILIFIIIIIAFNIFGSLTMLIIEKKNDIETFRSLGATGKLTRKIFTLEGWLISLLGLSIGLVIGLAFAFAQLKFGFIKMPGNFVTNAYPVAIEWVDILLTVSGVAIIGYIAARIPVRRNIK